MTKWSFPCLIIMWGNLSRTTDTSKKINKWVTKTSFPGNHQLSLPWILAPTETDPSLSWFIRLRSVSHLKGSEDSWHPWDILSCNLMMSSSNSFTEFSFRERIKINGSWEWMRLVREGQDKICVFMENSFEQELLKTRNKERDEPEKRQLDR
jgi:hypothetical protein